MSASAASATTASPIALPRWESDSTGSPPSRLRTWPYGTNSADAPLPAPSTQLTKRKTPRPPPFLPKQAPSEKKLAYAAPARAPIQALVSASWASGGSNALCPRRMSEGASRRRHGHHGRDHGDLSAGGAVRAERRAGRAHALSVERGGDDSVGEEREDEGAEDPEDGAVRAGAAGVARDDRGADGEGGPPQHGKPRARRAEQAGDRKSCECAGGAHGGPPRRGGGVGKSAMGAAVGVAIGECVAARAAAAL